MVVCLSTYGRQSLPTDAGESETLPEHGREHPLAAVIRNYSIIRGYTISRTKYALQHTIDFIRQPRYNDRIIRDAEEYGRISDYILGNVRKWAEDGFYG